nr:PAS domain S-box protein [uncultured Desulfobacter sp.]
MPKNTKNIPGLGQGRSLLHKMLTDEERLWLKSHPVIRVGFAPRRPPFEFADATGFHGIVPDYYALFGKLLDVEFKPIIKNGGGFFSWRQLLQLATEKKVDVLPGLLKTQSRTAFLKYTRSYIDFPWVLVVPSHESADKIKAFYGKKVASVGPYPSTKQLSLLHPELNIVQVESPFEGLTSVARGEVDAFFSNVADAAYWISNRKFEQLKIACWVEEIDSRLHIGVRKDWPVLVSILNKTLDSLTPKDHAAIHNRWVSIDYEKGLDWAKLLKVAVPAAAVTLTIIALMFLANRRLKKEIAMRRKAQRAAVQSQEKFRIIADYTYGMETWHDETGQLRWINRAAKLLTGYSEEQCLAMDEFPLPMVAPEDHAKCREINQAAMAGSSGNDVPLRFHTRNGDLIWLSVSWNPVYQDDGTYFGFRVSCRDVTERMEARSRLRIISEHTYDWQSWYDLKGGLVWVNQAVERITGYPPEECMHMADYPCPLIDPRDLDLYHHRNDLARHGAGRQEFGVRIRKKDNTLAWVFMSLEPVFDDDNQVSGIASISKDITSQKQAERELNLMARIFENTGDPIQILDLSHRILAVNDATVKAYGYSREELLGESISIIVPEDTYKRGRELFQCCLDGEVVRDVEWERKKRDGTIVSVLLTFALLKNDEGEPIGVAFITKDITKLKQAEQKLKDYKDHLEALVEERTTDLARAMRMAEEATRAKSEFLANMSHEIRTPLNAVVGFAHLALQTELDALQSDYITKIQDSSKVLLGVINDILDFSKIEAGKLSMESIEFSLDEVLDNVTTLVGVKAQQKGLEVVFNIGPALPWLLIGDPLRLGQILINLTNNAVKFTKTGEIVLGCSVLREDENDVELKFYVQDTGIGMTDAQQTKLFRAFSQTDTSTTREYGGTGLGLVICKSLVEMMNGRIWVESAPGQGATFFFTVCLEKAGGAQAYALGPDSALYKSKVLVVDDNYVCRTVLATMLEAMSFRVTQADGAGAGLAELEAVEKDDPFKLVLMDWQMPDMDGLHASRKIRETLKMNVPRVIMASAYAREELMQNADAMGLDGYLIKPVSPSLMFNTIMAALGVKPASRKEADRKSFGLNGIQSVRGARLLVVEDNEINQQVVKGILENSGFAVDMADNGRMAVDAVAQKAYDAVLMDIHMPLMDGYTATRIIRENDALRDLPIIAATANAMAGDREKALAAGMNDHVAKPINVRELLNVLNKWIKKTPKVHAVAQDGTAVQEKKPHNGAHDEPFKDLEGIDFRQGLARMSGNMDLYRKLLLKFAVNQADTGIKLEKALGVKDVETARRLAHTIKGVAGNISAQQVFKTATDLDAALKSGDIQKAESILPIFSEYLQQAIQTIETLET